MKPFYWEESTALLHRQVCCCRFGFTSKVFVVIWAGLTFAPRRWETNIEREIWLLIHLSLSKRTWASFWLSILAESEVNSMEFSGLSYTGIQPMLYSEPFLLGFSSVDIYYYDLPLIKGYMLISFFLWVTWVLLSPWLQLMLVVPLYPCWGCLELKISGWTGISVSLCLKCFCTRRCRCPCEDLLCHLWTKLGELF